MVQSVTMNCIEAANSSHGSAFKGCQVPQPMEDAGKETAWEPQNSFQREY